MQGFKPIKRFTKNKHGRDFVVGDIHGYFTALQSKLDEIGFDCKVDRLFSCGDLVDRGPESHHAIDWLSHQWFQPVRGNHDDYVCRYKNVDTENWLRNGGLWFQCLSPREKTEQHDAFSFLPYIIEVETDDGLIGIVHADPTVKDWAELVDIMGSRVSRNSLMWSRKRVESMDRSEVDGVWMVVCGHTPVKEHLLLGNVMHIDTAGWHKDGHFTILDITNAKIYS